MAEEKKKRSSSIDRREQFYPTPQLKDKLTQYAAKNEMSKSEVVNIALKNYLTSQTKQG